MSEVSVLASFQGGQLQPRAFRRGRHTYKVSKINLTHTTRQGQRRIIYFNVSDQANSWVLIFDTQTLQWQIQDPAFYS